MSDLNPRFVKYNIDYMVKQRLRERDLELQQRRERLRCLLALENLQYGQELNLLSREREEENAERRKEWIGQMRLDRERAEEELLKLKKAQRELDSEEYRHLKSRELLLETKQAQLYQIEEKKALREKEAKIEAMWMEAWRRSNEEKSSKEVYERKLQKYLADFNQEANCLQEDSGKERSKEEKLQLQNYYNEEFKKSEQMERQLRQDENFYQWRKKLHQSDVLQRQILKNTSSKELSEQLQSLEMQMLRSKIQADILNELDRKGAEQVKNRKWHQEYLQHTRNEKQAELKEAQEFDQRQLEINGLCLPQPRIKKPYGKAVR